MAMGTVSSTVLFLGILFEYVTFGAQADFGAALGRPESARFGDARRAWPISRLSPAPFRAVDLISKPSESHIKKFIWRLYHYYRTLAPR